MEIALILELGIINIFQLDLSIGISVNQSIIIAHF